MKGEFITSAALPAQFLRSDLPEFAMIGHSNVGKSSLINSLLNMKNIARTSRTPGRTQLVNFFRVNDSFHLVDLPGYGYSKAREDIGRTWAELLDAYLQRRQIIRHLFLWDLRRDLKGRDWQLAQSLSEQKPLTIVITKIDKLSKQECQRRIKTLTSAFEDERINFDKIFPVSANTKAGMAELRAHLLELVADKTR